MTQPRYLTKSRFKTAVVCPTKLFYSGKREFANKSLDDPFLSALARGGYQIGELAKHYFPGGVEIGRGDYQETSNQTRTFVESGNATIYEAAFQVDKFFILADVIVVKGNVIELYEVKAKSFDPHNDSFNNKNGTLASDWKPYLYDVAFQKMAIQKAFPNHEVRAHLTLVDKSKRSGTDGLNQKFRVQRDESGRNIVSVSGLTADDLVVQLLHNENVDEICQRIFAVADWNDTGMTFEGAAYAFAEMYANDTKMRPTIKAICKDCEFKANPKDIADGLLDGFKQCWTEVLGWTDDDFAAPSMLDIWDFRKKDKLIAENRIKIETVTEDDIGISKDSGKVGLARTERQWLQVQKAKTRDMRPHVEVEHLRTEMASWTFPLHFIDFETAMPPIPFTANRRPYEGVAFQFSHHILYEDGSYAHKGQCLIATPGVFPNFNFIRALKNELETDAGSIFRYASHENSYLNTIANQLADAPDVADRDELIAFIRTITKATQKSDEQWEGVRSMVDMLDLVKRFYYDPQMGGSNSIKQVLPAVLNSSEYLRKKYSRPIYGADAEIKSLNFTAQTWVQFDENDKVIDPYKLLPKMFQDVSEHDFALLVSEESELKDGGAAMTAYGTLQNVEMSDFERQEIETALLKYCELDTLAMVMIYEAWREMLDC